jgi:hypothetical protein
MDQQDAGKLVFRQAAQKGPNADGPFSAAC